MIRIVFIKKYIKFLILAIFLLFVLTIFPLVIKAWVGPTEDPTGGQPNVKNFCEALIFDSTLSPPGNVQVEPLSLTEARVSWSANPLAHSYRVSMGTETEGPYGQVDIVEHPADFLDVLELSSDGEYYFVVEVSTNGEKWSNYSDEVYIKMPVTPGAPTGLEIDIYSETALDLEWVAPENDGGADITGYKIERKTTGDYSTIVENTGNADTIYRNTGLTENTEYTYRVSTITVVESSPSNEKSKFTGHCVSTTASCLSGYTSILGGSQSGCATVGPVTSPYPGSGDNRYRIVSNEQTLTESGCHGSSTQTRTRQPQISTDAATSYTWTGTPVNCRICQNGAACRWRSRFYVLYGDTIHHCQNNGHTCRSDCWLDCTTNSGCAVCAYNRSCENLSATSRWCCRN